MKAMMELCGVGSWSLALMLAVQSCAVQESDVGLSSSEAELASSEAELEAAWNPLRRGECRVEGTPLADGSYAKLSDTGLYCDIQRDVINADLRFYKPAFTLWADGADKRRFLWLPPGTQIDTSDMDQWVFPVGTKVWKEFSRDAKKLETRLLEKVNEETWLAVAFAWTSEGDEAYPVYEGASNTLGTDHDIPSRAQCNYCHGGASDMPLGVSALQLGRGADPSGINLAKLAWTGQLSDPPRKPIHFPGARVDQQALGYLYANCTSCHGRNRAMGGLDLSTSVHDERVADTRAYQTTVNQALRIWTGQGYDTRIVPGVPEESGLLARMDSREPGTQMPPLGSALVDDKGLKQIRSWIASLD